jgi:hypothetical protein
MNQLVSNCPVCNGPFHVERLGCDRCQSALEGHFALGWLARLTREQLTFVELLVKNRGNINGVATELKIAYNTARSRLDDVVAALGYVVPPPERPAARQEVLTRLEAGEITVEQATQLLRGDV